MTFYRLEFKLWILGNSFNLGEIDFKRHIAPTIFMVWISQVLTYLYTDAGGIWICVYQTKEMLSLTILKVMDDCESFKLVRFLVKTSFLLMICSWYYFTLYLCLHDHPTLSKSSDQLFLIKIAILFQFSEVVVLLQNYILHR